MPSLRMITVALITSLGGSFHFGFQLVLTNPAENAFLNFLNMTLGSHYKDGLSESTLEVSDTFNYYLMLKPEKCEMVHMVIFGG